MATIRRGSAFSNPPIASADAGGQDPAPIRQASPSSDTAPATVTTMFTRAYDAFALGSAWLSQLAVNDDSILRREGAQDLRLYDALLDDDVAFSSFQQRRLAVIARPWTIDPGNPDNPKSVQAADDFREMMKAVGWDRITSGMLFGSWYGYAVGEGILEVRQKDGRSLIWLTDIVVPDRKWFAFTNDGELRMRSPGEANGVAVPPNKFWTFRVGATHDFAHYGTGLAHWCYWPIWFKRNVLQFWALYLEKYGQPTAVGYYQQGATSEQIGDLLSALKAIGSDSAVAIPAPPAPAIGSNAGPDLRPTLMEAQRSGGADSYQQFVGEMNDALRGVILGQPGTSRGVSDGLNGNQADVHKDVRDEVVKADSDALHESFNPTFPAWITLWNYGPDVEPPIVYRELEDAEDIGAIADRDVKLAGIGIKRTPESVKDVYGDGYTIEPTLPKASLKQIGAALGGTIDPETGAVIPAAQPGVNDNQPNAKALAFAAFAAGDVAPLYVSRKLLNAADVLAWARKAGIANLEDAADLHVTVCYSREAVDWFGMPQDYWSDQDGNLTVRPGGPRKVELFGKGALVLMFASDDLRWRHDDLTSAGASDDWPEYRPHVTLSYDPGDVDPASIEPYAGELRFGPEIWQRLDTDPLDGVMAGMTFSAEQEDEIDRLTAAMQEHSEPIFQAMGEALRDKLAEFSAGGRGLTAQQFRTAALQAWERFPVDDLARVMALPFAAERAASAAGVEDQVQP